VPKYLFVAKNYDGEVKTGETEAKNEREVVEQLRNDGFLVTSLKKNSEEEKTKIAFLDRFTRISLKDKMMFARNLGVMISSGLTISKAIENLSAQTKNKKLKSVLSKIRSNIESGKNLSDSLEKYPAIFNDLFVNMVRVGEIGGNLDEVLRIVALQLEKEHSLKSKIRGALMYPAVILIAMIGVGFLMLTYILPKITGVFADMDVSLPKSTQFIIALSDFLQAHFLLSLILLSLGPIFLRFFFKTNFGKKVFSLLLIKIPAIKNITIKVNCARFSRIYSSLLRSGVTSLDALRIVSKTLTNHYYRQALNDSVKQIQKGVDLSSVIKKYEKIFPVLIYQMIEVGEQTGETEAVLLKVAEFYEEEVNQITKNLSSIIEPVLMILIGGAVGFFAVSMLQPMYGLMENIN
jgi:type IV pilus assembly protein PilC